MLRRTWSLLRATVEGFIEDEAMTRGAAITCYSMFSLAPLIVIVTAIAGLAYGEQAVEGIIAEQLQDLLGARGAEAVQALVRSAYNPDQGNLAALIGAGTLLITSTVVFAEVQAALDAIWRAPPPPGNTVMQIIRTRLLGFLLVALTGLLLMASVVASTVLSALATWATAVLPQTRELMSLVNFGLSFLMVTALFAAIYKVLPNRRLAWMDVLVGALVTALLFTIGKSLLGWYLGSAAVANVYGAAGALMVVLLWIYYSTQIFLLGAEFTRAWAGLRAIRPQAPKPAAPEPPPRPPSKGWGIAALGGILAALLRRR
ncbi:YihY/virulence factor BrkB family protein [Crenalkalicoccus roseus]|uniref:YihY/virulence factor BrkB family protein n=1 Tax=Crenalkalicoccus roseus TaxID=1485588 RepID=UPI001080CD95|nr:YihY/virulence factor BrkB family protein [Crenalkalicoccus roseus]